ncbi:MAG: NAD(P)H-hydrate dehydratase [Bryobacteraceae bacterium]|jgi:NAD(P)H-hydrate epimerase
MKVLTAAEMREVDRRTIEMGIPGIVLMENAGMRVVEFLAERFAPLEAQRVVVLCGKGNNGGDGLVIARQIHTCFPRCGLTVVLLAEPEDLRGDARANYAMLRTCAIPVYRKLPDRPCDATLVVDALLGTGISGPATGEIEEAICFTGEPTQAARVVAVDIPSGMSSDAGESAGRVARADYTVTFTAPKLGQVMPPNCDSTGELIVRPIGTPPELLLDVKIDLVEPSMFSRVMAPRPPGGHKGTFGHALVVAGSRGKTGAAALCGLGALRAGAGLVTVASAESAIPQIAAHAPELMTEPLAETPRGSIALNAALAGVAEGKTVVAMGPGLGRQPEISILVTSMMESLNQPMVIDADALVDIGKVPLTGRVRVLTPHPGEMARLTGKTVAEVQADRIGIARAFAETHWLTLVLKGQRTIIAFPDGRVWINPTGTPAMGTGGTGDVLTGMIAGFLAQFPQHPDEAVAAAVYLHGLSGQIGARALGERCLIASDLLEYLPAAMEECAALPRLD